MNLEELKSLQACGWEDVVSQIDKEEYSYLMEFFKEKANTHTNELSKVCKLFSHASSMRLIPQRQENPFDAFFVFPANRSAIIDDFTDEEIHFFESIVDKVNNNLLKARLADIIWVRNKNHHRARIAIECYMLVPLDFDTWCRGGKECWHRAIVLAKKLRAQDESENIKKTLLKTLLSCTEENGYFALKIANLLYENKLGRNSIVDIAKALISLSDEFKNLGDLQGAIDYLEGAYDWYASPEFENERNSILVCLGALYKEQGDMSQASMQKNALYEKAIQVYRQISSQQRQNNDIDKKIEELKTLLQASGKAVLTEMVPIEIPEIDISVLLQQAENAVKGKKPKEALCGLAAINRKYDYQARRNEAIKTIQEFPIQALFSTTAYSRDGRVIQKTQGVGFHESSTISEEKQIHRIMMRNYALHIDLVVHGLIFPALQILNSELHLQESDFIYIAQHSSLVPLNHKHLWGKALFSGYSLDFVTSMHLLAPQLENMIRSHLKELNVQTTTLDPNGIEMEVGLSTLMEKPEAKELMDENTYFEMNALFSDQLGPNFRNEVAHGLLSDSEFFTSQAIYAWWFCFKLVFSSFWHATTPTEESKA